MRSKKPPKIKNRVRFKSYLRGGSTKFDDLWRGGFTIFRTLGGYRFGRLLLHQRHGYTYFVALMETEVDSRRINLCSKKSKILNFFCSFSSIFFVCLIRKLRFWYKSQPFYSWNLEVLQRKSNIPTHFFPFSWGKTFICAKVLNGNLPLHAIFLFSYWP